MDVLIRTLILIVFTVLHLALASWWSLGLSGTYTHVEEKPQHSKRSLSNCDDLKFLGSRQRELCRLDDRIVDVLSKGAAVGIAECQHQFQNRRWNCSVFNTTNVFGNILGIMSRETAYIYSIFSAGVMHSITKACAQGVLAHCGCDGRIKNLDTAEKFKWGGCSENVRYSRKFTRDFVDDKEMKHNESGLMNLWNNEAGRRAIKNNVENFCKCHGVSGSCTTKICFRRTRSFRDIGTYLKRKFDGANRVKLNKRRRKLKPLSRQLKRPKKDDLVYLQESPDFCERDMRYGSLGTHNRICNISSQDIDGCNLLCCGRGYYTTVHKVILDCDCKFLWCCRVQCTKCPKVIEQYHCN